MISIHAVQELFLQTLEELAELVTEEQSFGELEEAVQRLTGQVTLRVLELVLAGIDERLMQERDRSRYVCLDVRERVLDTPLGELRVKRRYYRDRYFPRACYRLDRLHLRRALREALSPAEEAYGRVCRALEAGDWASVESALRQALRGRHGPARERLLRLRGYLRENWEGIVTSGERPRLGAIETEVLHVLARRMKRHGARWSERGADHLARLLSERFDPNWRAVLGSRRLQVSPSVRRAMRQAVQRVVGKLQEDPTPLVACPYPGAHRAAHGQTLGSGAARPCSRPRTGGLRAYSPLGAPTGA